MDNEIERNKEILNLYLNGKTMTDLATDFGVSRSKIRNILSKMNSDDILLTNEYYSKLYKAAVELNFSKPDVLAKKAYFALIRNNIKHWLATRSMTDDRLLKGYNIGKNILKIVRKAEYI